MARGEQRRGSDLDVFIIGNASFGEVVETLTPAPEKLAREINAVVYPVSEFREKAGVAEEASRQIFSDLIRL
jgi:predicted nucleotidyltransferase